MSTSLQNYIFFSDGTCRSTGNISSVAWVIYLPTNELVFIHRICFGQTTNNIEEYSATIIFDAVTFGIRSLIIRLDSQINVLHLNRVYAIINPVLLRLFLKVRLLEQQFDYIEYQHISINLNTLADALAKQVLNRHLQH